MHHTYVDTDTNVMDINESVILLFCKSNDTEMTFVTAAPLALKL